MGGLFFKKEWMPNAYTIIFYILSFDYRIASQLHPQSPTDSSTVEGAILGYQSVLPFLLHFF